MAAMLSLIMLVATSVWRRPLRLSYEAWHAIHAVLAVVLVVGAVRHIIFVDEYVSSLWKQILWALMSAAFVCLLICPFSFSSSAERGEVEVAIKALGDFTSTVDGLEPGTKVYVDGPHGAFSINQDEGPGSR